MTKNLYVEDEDIHCVLKRKLDTSDYELAETDLQLPEGKIGLLGDHAFLKTKVKLASQPEPQELFFFVKYFPFDENSAALATENGAFSKETFINGKLFKEMKRCNIDLIYKCVPKCYLQKKDSILFFEDLTKDGYTIMDKTKTCDFETMLIILKSLAQLHASSLIYEEKRSDILGDAYRLINEYEQELEEAFYTKDKLLVYMSAKASCKAVQTEIDFFEFPQKLPSGRNFKAVVERSCNKIFDLVKPSTKYRNVICHGDLWYSNIFLKLSNKNSSSSAPTACKFVDFQLFRYAPPAHDVMCAIFLNTTTEFRKKHLYELIGLYYVALERHLKLAELDLKKIIPFSEFLESCEEQKLFAVIQSALYAQLIYLDGDVLGDFFSNAALSSYALQEDRSVLVLAHINKNEYYRNKLQDTIQELWNYCQWL